MKIRVNNLLIPITSLSCFNYNFIMRIYFTISQCRELSRAIHRIFSVYLLVIWFLVLALEFDEIKLSYLAGLNIFIFIQQQHVPQNINLHMTRLKRNLTNHRLYVHTSVKKILLVKSIMTCRD